MSETDTNKNGLRDPLVIANYLLDTARKKGDFLTPLQIIKLVYIAHGWFLAYFGKPLLREPVEAWRYGPVIPSVYAAVRHLKGAPIKDLFPGADNGENLSADERGLLNAVFRAYRKFSGTQLSALTHAEGTPWEKTWDNVYLNKEIPDEVIRSHFLAKKAKLT